jgi:hypothetical protein
VRDDQIRVPGLASYHALYRVSQQDGGALNLRLSVIRKGAYIYTFSALASESDFAGFEAPFRQTARSFTGLTNPAFLGRKPSQINTPGDILGRGSEEGYLADPGHSQRDGTRGQTSPR